MTWQHHVWTDENDQGESFTIETYFLRLPLVPRHQDIVATIRKLHDPIPEINRPTSWTIYIDSVIIQDFFYGNLETAKKFAENALRHHIVKLNNLLNKHLEQL